MNACKIGNSKYNIPLNTAMLGRDSIPYYGPVLNPNAPHFVPLTNGSFRLKSIFSDLKPSAKAFVPLKKDCLEMAPLCK